ncbi:MAG: fatty acid desaturase [Candidatus Thiothrix singaporensis]|uniref:Fatty acid desaturase n=1 Tax=Candidatus Thiothrix singaporensis TaxID=2799669 RepID=A0A7L6AWF8_9GAMM|nr:MAG: fatty acid desaturase [Candidatus Thiothrix singaporensis]
MVQHRAGVACVGLAGGLLLFPHRLARHPQCLPLRHRPAAPGDGWRDVLPEPAHARLPACRAGHPFAPSPLLPGRTGCGRQCRPARLMGNLAERPLFPLRLHLDAWRFASRRQKRWIRAELLGNAIILGAIWGWLENTVLQTHSLLMLVAYCLSAFFAVWTVHHDCATESWNNARTLRSPWKSLLFYNMFFHIEHHLFPAVPTCHLPELARRLDQTGYREHRWVL